MVEKIQFVKDDISETKTEIQKTTAKQTFTERNSREVSTETNLPDTFKVETIKSVTKPIDGRDITYSVLVSDKGEEFSVNRLYDLGYVGTYDNIKFKSSRFKSKLFGAGVLADSKPLSKSVSDFCAKYALTSDDFIAALVHHKVTLKITEVETTTYYPEQEITSIEDVKTYNLDADSLNEQHKTGKDIPGLKIGRKYRFELTDLK